MVVSIIMVKNYEIENSLNNKMVVNDSLDDIKVVIFKICENLVDQMVPYEGI